MLNKTLLAAVAATGLMAFGCDDKNAQKAATPEADKAAEKVAGEAKDVAKGVEKSIKGGSEELKDAAKGGNDAGKVDAENLRGNMTDLTGKLKKALDEKKFDEAQTFVQQLKDLKSKLPADAQVQVDAQLATADKLIAAGKATMGPAGH